VEFVRTRLVCGKKLLDALIRNLHWLHLVIVAAAVHRFAPGDGLHSDAVAIDLAEDGAIGGSGAAGTLGRAVDTVVVTDEAVEVVLVVARKGAGLVEATKRMGGCDGAPGLDDADVAAKHTELVQLLGTLLVVGGDPAAQVGGTQRQAVVVPDAEAVAHVAAAELDVVAVAFEGGIDAAQRQEHVSSVVFVARDLFVCCGGYRQR